MTNHHAPIVNGKTIEEHIRRFVAEPNDCYRKQSLASKLIICLPTMAEVADAFEACARELSDPATSQQQGISKKWYRLMAVALRRAAKTMRRGLSSVVEASKTWEEYRQKSSLPEIDWMEHPYANVLGIFAEYLEQGRTNQSPVSCEDRSGNSAFLKLSAVAKHLPDRCFEQRRRPQFTPRDYFLT